MNRAQRRKLGYGRPYMLPINLGINQYKKDHPGKSKRIAYYKQGMWEAHKELKVEDVV